MSEIHYVKNFREERCGCLLNEIRRLNNFKPIEQFDRNMIDYHHMVKKAELRILLESWVGEKISVIPCMIFPDKEKTVETIVNYILKETYDEDFISESMMGKLINDVLQRLYISKFDTIMEPVIENSCSSLTNITNMVKRGLHNETDNGKIQNMVKYLIDPPEDKLYKLFKFIVHLPLLKDITPKLEIADIDDTSNHQWIKPISIIILEMIKDGVVFEEFKLLKDYIVKSYLRSYWSELNNVMNRIVKEVRSDSVTSEDRWLVISIKDFINKCGIDSNKNLAVIEAIDILFDYEMQLLKLHIYLYRQLKEEGYPRDKDKLRNWLFTDDRLGHNRYKVVTKITEYFEQ